MTVHLVLDCCNGLHCPVKVTEVSVCTQDELPEPQAGLAVSLDVVGNMQYLVKMVAVYHSIK